MDYGPVERRYLTLGDALADTNPIFRTVFEHGDVCTNRLWGQAEWLVELRYDEIDGDGYVCVTEPRRRFPGDLEDC